MKQNPRFEHRTITKFLWWPKSIESKTKWLCSATWEETRCDVFSFNVFNPVFGEHVKWGNWIPTKWIDN